MPTAPIRMRSSPESGTETGALPPLLRTEFGVVLIDIQGVVNYGDAPLITSELDLGDHERPTVKGPVDIGRVEFPTEVSDGSAVTLFVGSNQKLSGVVQRLRTPLAVLDMESEESVECIDIIKYKLLFNKRPEPVHAH